MRKIYLIGGSPTAGKSTIASIISKKFQIPWISTDLIRDTLRLYANRKDHPNLFDPENYSAEKYLSEFSANQIVEMEFQQGEAVWNAIKYIIDNDYSWTKGAIIEGVSLLPHLIHKDYEKNNLVKSIFLIEENEVKIRKVVFERGVWDDAKNYSDAVKEKEVEWIKLFNKKIEEEAINNHLPIFKVNKKEEDLSSIIEILS